MTGTSFPHAIGRYRGHTGECDELIGGRVDVELDDGRHITAEAWPADAWDDTDTIDWNERITITVDESDARRLLSPDAFEELRTWMIDILTDAGALTAERDVED